LGVPAFDLYRELEVDPGASTETIEAAYRSLIKRHHPDRGANTLPGRAARLNVAREWLTDPTRRALYDSAYASSSSRPAAEQNAASRRARDRRGADGVLAAIAVAGLAVAVWFLTQAELSPGVVGLAVAALTLASLAVGRIAQHARDGAVERRRRRWRL
jgi:curved DNA-binding protein CbpA